MPKNISKIAIRNKVAAHAEEIINVLLELLRSKNPNARLGAAKILLNKVLPDLKIEEIVADGEKPILINLDIKQNESENKE